MRAQALTAASLALATLLLAAPALQPLAHAQTIEGGILPTTDSRWIIGYYLTADTYGFNKNLTIKYVNGSAEQNNLITLYHKTKWDGYCALDLVVFVRAVDAGDNYTVIYYLGDNLKNILLARKYMPDIAFIGLKLVDKRGWVRVNPYEKLYLHKATVSYERKYVQRTPPSKLSYHITKTITVTTTNITEINATIRAEIGAVVDFIGVGTQASINVKTTSITSDTYSITWNVSFSYYKYRIIIDINATVNKVIDDYRRSINSQHWFLAGTTTISFTVTKNKNVHVPTSDSSGTLLRDIEG